MKMSSEMWGALSAFPWADRARKHWRRLSAPTQRKVMAAARAEIAASERYLRADDAVLADLGPEQMPRARIRFTDGAERRMR